MHLGVAAVFGATLAFVDRRGATRDIHLVTAGVIYGVVLRASMSVAALPVVAPVTTAGVARQPYAPFLALVVFDGLLALSDVPGRRPAMRRTGQA